MFREENKYESQGGLRHNKANAWLQVKFFFPVVVLDGVLFTGNFVYYYIIMASKE